jgi:hypothetical protein
MDPRNLPREFSLLFRSQTAVLDQAVILRHGGSVIMPMR